MDMIDEIVLSGYKIPVLYEDNHLLVVVKPYNMPTQADSSGDRDLLETLKEYIGIKYQKPGKVYLGLVHRLDRPAGGVMVFARTSKAAARLSKDFAVHAQGREYLAVVRGELNENTMTDWLKNDEKSGFVRVANSAEPGAREARLDTHPLAFRDGLCLTRIELYTGRKHQIRVQHASHGHPLWGDARYGGGKPGQQLALWAWSLSITHPTKRASMNFRFLPPETMPWTVFSDEIAKLT